MSTFTTIGGFKATPLKNDGVRQIGSSSQRKWENKIHVPNHPPDGDFMKFSGRYMVGTSNLGS
jgi:hypothetical protein